MLTVARSIPPIPIAESPRYVGEGKGNVHILCTGPGTYEGHCRPLFHLIRLGSKNVLKHVSQQYQKGGPQLRVTQLRGSPGAWCVSGYASSSPPLYESGDGDWRLPGDSLLVQYSQRIPNARKIIAIRMGKCRAEQPLKIG